MSKADFQPGSRPTSRRTFLRRSCAAALAATGVSMTTVVVADDKVPEDDPTAVALGYKHDVSTVDTAKFPKRAGDAGATQFCDNCALYLNPTKPDAEWAPCSIFQNRLVAAKGWCNAWVPKS